MKRELILNLASDVRQLYLKTGVKSLEDAYVRLEKSAQVSGEEAAIGSPESFIDGIKNTSAAYKKRLPEPSLIDSIILLEKLSRENLPSENTYQAIMTRILKSDADKGSSAGNSALYWPPLWDIRDDPELGSISRNTIYHFRDILEPISLARNNIFQNGTPDAGPVAETLKTLEEGYIAKYGDGEEEESSSKISMESRIKSFSFLLREMSSRMGPAIDRNIPSVNFSDEDDKAIGNLLTGIDSGILADSGRVISSIPSLKTPEAQVVLSTLDQKSRAAAKKILNHFGNMKEEDIRSAVNDVANLLSQAMISETNAGVIMGRQPDPVEQEDKDFSYYMNDEWADMGVPKPMAPPVTKSVPEDDDEALVHPYSLAYLSMVLGYLSPSQ